MIEKAVEFEMPAVAFSDSGNMMGAFHFVETAYKHNSKIDLEIKEFIKKNQLSEEKILKLKKKRFFQLLVVSFRFVMIEMINHIKTMATKFLFS